MTPSTTSRPGWTRLAQAMVLYLACHPTKAATTSSSSSSPKRRLRQRQHTSNQLKEESTLSNQSLEQPRTPLTTTPQPRDLETRIVNGRDARGSDDFPFFAQWYRGCGATLIHSDIILTAAHCYSDTFAQHKVRIEGAPATAQGGLLEVVDARVHPEFNDETNWVNNNEYDFMVLKLEAPLPQVRPVPIHNADVLPLHDQEDLTIIGYGLTSEDGTVATILQEATVQYHEDCSFASYRPEKVGQETMFCAHGVYNATHSVDSCQGDSGGPILRKTPQGWMQVGVTSWGEGCARPEAPGIYARTVVAYDWIQSMLCELSVVPPPHCTSSEIHSNGNLEMAIVVQEEEEEEGILANETSNQIGLPTEDMISSPQLDAAQSLLGANTTTTVSTTTSLRIDVQYDDYPQEISWALAKQDEESNNKKALKDETSYTLIHVSRRQPITVRNKKIAQQILNVEAGSNYKLEFYDTIAGDGLTPPTTTAEAAAVDAIQVWQLEAIVETTLVWDESTQSSVPISTKELHAEATLLWSHIGDFGEFVRTMLDIQQQKV